MKYSIVKALAALTALILTALPLSAAEVVTYYHNDHLGSPIAATDSTGTVVWQQAYDPWGLKLTVNTDERGYTGNWLDEETGLADHKARWYTSSMGRFTGIDPVKWQESSIHSFNRYAYANNNPYKYVDRNGEFAFPVVPILGVMALEALGIGLEVAMMEETSDSINRSGAGTFGATGVKLLGSSLKMGLNSTKAGRGIADLFKAGRAPKASELKKFAEQKGWKPSQTTNGPLKYFDNNGIERITIKRGSSRTPGSENPHVALRNASGQRVDPAGNPVTQRSPGNHTPIKFDL